MFGRDCRISSTLLVLAGVLAAAPLAAHAQFSQASQVPQAMADSPALKPPTGANVAIVEFSDLECPACAAANPTLVNAMEKYHVPLVRHDFLIPTHNWSKQGAINARWFDEKSPKLGEAYRDAIFAQQQSISTNDDLNAFTQKFAQEHNVALPFVMDPQGKLADEVRADKELGVKLGVNRTPTIWVVTAHSHDAGHPYVQVTDPQLLFSYLDQAVSATAVAKSTQASTARKSHGTR